MTLVEWIDKNLYPEFSSNWDDELLRKRVLESLRPQHAVLDLGAGAGIVTQMNFRGLAAKVCGVDPDPRVVDNPYLDEGKEGVGESVPYADGTFDVVVADNVLEHLERPSEVFREVARVLRPTGEFIVKTPNKSHYMPLIARLTPLAFHRFYNRVRGRRGEDTFKTIYRANTRADISALAAEVGLKVEKFEYIEGRAEYLRIAGPLYVLGTIYERIVNSIPALASLRIVIICKMVKV